MRLNLTFSGFCCYLTLNSFRKSSANVSHLPWPKTSCQGDKGDTPKTSSCPVIIMWQIALWFILEHLYCRYWQATLLERKDIKIIQESSSLRNVGIFLSFGGWAWFQRNIWINYKNFSPWKNANGLDAKLGDDNQEQSKRWLRKRCKGLSLV